MADVADHAAAPLLAENAKAQVLALLDRLPGDVTLEQIQYHLGVYVKITRSEERADREGWIPHDEVSRRIDAWFAK